MKKFPAILAALLAGLLVALPQALNRAESLDLLGQAVLSPAPSPAQRLSLLAFHLAGWAGFGVLWLLLRALPWAAALLALLVVAEKLPSQWRRTGSLCAWGLCLLAAGWGASTAIFSGGFRPSDPRLREPIALVEMAKSAPSRVFVNPSARPAVAALSEGLPDKSLPEKSVVELATNPSKWRAEDRAKPFSAVLLSGRIAEARPLLRHLLDAPDWYLARLDNQGLLFLRGEKSDIAVTPVPGFSTGRERAVYLAQYSLNLDAAGFRTMAATSMEEALGLAGKDYEVLFRAASLAASQSRWERARKQASAAAKTRPGAYEAEYLLALSLLETRSFEKAFDRATKLAKKFPDDPSALLLLSRCARAARDFTAETEALQRLLALAQADGTPTARIHIYLAQSWAQRGFADQSLAHYREALAEGLPPDESRDVRAAIAAIESAVPR